MLSSNLVAIFLSLSYKSVSYSAEWPTAITIGLVTSYLDTKFYQIAVNETVKDLKTDGVIPMNLNINVAQIQACEDAPSLNASVNLFFRSNVSALFGPECSTGMTTAALFASTVDMPIFGFVSITSLLANKTKYTTLTRTSNAISYLSEAISILLVNYQWTSVAIIQNKTGCDIVLSGITEKLKKKNIGFSDFITADFTSTDELNSALNDIASSARIVLVCGGSSPKTALALLKAASKLNMLTPDYVYIIPHYSKTTLTHWEPWLDPNITISENVDDLRRYYQNAIVIETSGEMSQAFHDFNNRMEKATQAFGTTQWNIDNMLKIGTFRDGLYLYGKTLNESIENGLDYRSGREVSKAAADEEFMGVTGRVKIDSNAERVSNYFVEKMNETGDFDVYILMGHTENFSAIDEYIILDYLYEPDWRTAQNTAPLAVPICGFTNELCPAFKISYKSLAIGLPIAAVVVTASVILSLYLFRKRIFEKGLQTLVWKIDIREIQFVARKYVQSSMNRSNSTSTLRQTADRSMSLSHGEFKSIDQFDGFGMYKGAVITIERWKRNGNVVLKREHLIHLKYMKELNHENLNTFIGFSHDNIFKMCLWLHCSKGNLHDIVFNDDIKLDHTFKVSILRDIISGLDFLHSTPIGYHGRLLLNECTVDGRWTVKLTNFGLNEVLNEMRRQKVIGREEDTNVAHLMCNAPEVLRHQTPINLKSVDVYQYGMIAYQVLYRQEPFGDFELMPNEIVDALKNGNFKGAVLRPRLRKVDNFDFQFHRLIQSTWNENPALRPLAQDIKKVVFNRTKSQLGSKTLIDHVMSMLEKYAANLEKIVDERTAQLREEQKRADQLLYQMLPKSVADALKSGRTVDPELFDCVTVYFSDIVGFTKICSRSKPVEIVAMLNGAYSQFDSVIMCFDAYKVETIGDAYLVVSGLPVRNGSRHVTTIADMSLKIMQVLGIYRIPHLPEERVQIRIGIHSGSVAGGVVGLIMPKYCLFGDTVNMASRMESSGEPGKIHISEFTKTLLEPHSAFSVTERGEIDIKGKGKCTTYWLESKFGNR